jgi:WD40 repeat protein
MKNGKAALRRVVRKTKLFLSFLGLFITLVLSPTLNPTLSQSPEPFTTYTIAWSHDGTRIAVGGGISECGKHLSLYAIQITDAAGKLIHSMERHSCNVLGLSWSPDDSQLASSASDGMRYISDPITGYMISQSEEMPLGFDRKGIVWNAQGTRIADFVPAYNQLFVWHPITGDTLTTFTNTDDIHAIAWNRDGEQIAVGSQTGEIHIVSAVTGEMFRTFIVGEPGDAWDLDWSPDGDKLAVGGFKTRIVDSKSGKTLNILEERNAFIVDLDWHPDSLRLVTIDDTGTVRVWDTATGNQLNVFTSETPINAVAWSPDGKKLAYGGKGDEMISIVEVAKPSTVLSTLIRYINLVTDILKKKH